MLHRLRLWNFKSFGKADVELRQVTLLAGLNAAGKSSLVQALLLIRQNYLQSPRPRALELNGDLVRLGTAKEVLFEYAETDRIRIDLEFSDATSASWLLAVEGESEVLEVLEGPQDHPDLQHSPLGGEFRYLTAERWGPRVAFPLSEYMVRRGDIGTHGEYSVHYLVKWGDEPAKNQRASHPVARSPSLGHQVEAWLGELCPGVRLNYRAIRPADITTIGYAFTKSLDVISSYYRATNVGFGVSYSLPIVVAILSAMPGDIVAIENPEAHLHPRGQTQLGRLIALIQPGAQVLVETHSDHVLNGLRIAVRERLISPEQVRLHYVERKDGASQTKSPKIDVEGRLDYWPDGFFDEYEKTLAALLSRRDIDRT
jgi:predicted ATPase